jgi:exodeoxyribonuclease VII small subunit
MKKAVNEETVTRLAALTAEAIAALPYETAMLRLEETVEALEQEGTPLDLGLRLYEVGTALSRRCGKILDTTEERMLQLLGEGATAREEPFEPEKDGR